MLEKKYFKSNNTRHASSPVSTGKRTRRVFFLWEEN
jgi:hypothetical protein